ncbi:IS5 family transposase [Micromonospora maritima]|uniref:IS5 family transposase n=1 Tax=Micromonospora maritima TaxID=986711 RepID=UPI0037B66EBD
MTLNPARPSAGERPRAVCTCGCSTRARRYPSDTTDAEWQVLEPLLSPPACDRPGGGRPEKHHRRAIIDAIFYLVDNGIKWRAMPTDFPPWRTVYGFLARWHDDLTALTLTDRLREHVRHAAGRTATPTAGCVDSQSVHECAEGTVSRDSSGYDPYKRVNGRKRHIVVDTLGLLIAVHVTAANVQDRDGARPVVHQAALHGVQHIWADNGYHGDLIRWATDLDVSIEIVPRPTGGKGFQVLPRRWVVERTFAWLTRRRRCARDYERLPEHHETIIYWAAILQMARRHARTTTLDI